MNFKTYCLFVCILFLLVACSNDGLPAEPPIVPSPTLPNVSIEIAGGADGTLVEYREVRTEQVPQQNCGGSAEVENAVERARAVTHVIEVGLGLTVSASGSVGISGTKVELGAEIASQFGQSYGVEETLARSLTVKAAAGTNMQHEIVQREVWRVGEAVVLVNGEETRIPFSYQSDFAVELIQSDDLGCQSETMEPEPASPEMATTTPTAVSTAPTNTPAPTPMPTDTSQPPEATATPEPPNGFIAPGMAISNSLAEDAFDEYKFVGRANQPVLFTIQVINGGLDYRVKIFDSLGIELEDFGNQYDHLMVTIPFTPPDNEEYTLQLLGFASFGDYVIRMSYVDDSAANSEQVLQIAPNESFQNQLAVGAVDSYQFAGVSNQPVLFAIQVTEGNLDYRVRFYDSFGFEIEDAGLHYDHLSPEIPFTPLESANYTIELEGRASFGEYVIQMKYVDDPPPDPDKVFLIGVGESQQENLAAKAVDRYQFTGASNQTVTFKIQVTSGFLDYEVRIFDAANNLVKDAGRFFDHFQPTITFTPASDGVYLLHLIGVDRFGSYVIVMGDQ